MGAIKRPAATPAEMRTGPGLGFGSGLMSRGGGGVPSPRSTSITPTARPGVSAADVNGARRPVVDHCHMPGYHTRGGENVQRCRTGGAGGGGMSGKVGSRRRRRRRNEHHGQRLLWQCCGIKEGNQDKRRQQRCLQKKRADRKPFAAGTDASRGFNQTVFEHEAFPKRKIERARHLPE
jgi:hypothetical protein